MDYYAEWYVYPFFHQSWSLFVPAPNTNYHLYAEYEDHGPKRKDVFEEILLNHQRNRLKGYGPLVIAFTNSIHYFEKNTELLQPLNGPVKNDLYFKMVENSTLQYLKNTLQENIKEVKIKLVVESIDTGKSRVYYN